MTTTDAANDPGTQTDPGTGTEITVENVWTVNSMVFKDANGNVESSMYFPNDLYEYRGNTDPDGDGTVETGLVYQYLEISSTNTRLYEKFDVTDGGSDTTTLAADGDVDSFYYSDQAFTLNADGLNGYLTELRDVDDDGTDETVTNYMSFTISGQDMTIDVSDDEGTPGDSSDDTSMVWTLTLASPGDVSAAIPAPAN